ncbi:hypothetical protein ACL02T_30035 [Pseudonocardia sp. RS010]|uniref:hypothetical protein n=1 Tax=Pseudonocardia sp. RS010 TaxID=3385979 RepID=UPI0039A37162
MSEGEQDKKKASGFSAAVEVTVRVSGEVPVRVDVTNAGTPEQQVGLTLGSVLIYLRNPGTVRAVVEGWRSANYAAQLLGPSRPVTYHHAGLAQVMGSQVSTLVRLGGIPNVLVAPITRRPGSPVPSHLRMQVGPIVWQVCDWNAYHSIAVGWERAGRLLNVGQVAEPNPDEEEDWIAPRS